MRSVLAAVGAILVLANASWASAQELVRDALRESQDSPDAQCLAALILAEAQTDPTTTSTLDAEKAERAKWFYEGRLSVRHPDATTDHLRVSVLLLGSTSSDEAAKCIADMDAFHIRFTGEE